VTAVAAPRSWPFLFGQAGRHGNRALLVPGLPVGPDFVAALHRAARTGAAGFATDDGRPYTVVSRRVEALSDGDIRLFESGTGRLSATLRGHRGRVSTVDLAPDGRVLATAGWDGALRLWDVTTGTALAGTGLAGTGLAGTGLAGCRFDPSGTRVATCAYDGTVVVFDTRSGTEVSLPPSAIPPSGALAFNAPGRILFVADREGGVLVLHLPSRAALPPLRVHDAAITSMALGANRRLLATASRDGTAVVWDLVRRAPLVRLRGHAGWVTGCAFANGGTRVLTSGWDGTVRSWDLSGRSATLALSGEAHLTALTSTVDGQAIVADGLGRILAVDLARSTAAVVVDGLPGTVDALSGSPDGQLLVAGGLTDPASGGVPATDGYGRPATFTEGLVLPGADVPFVPSRSDWDRVRAASLEAFAVASADPTGRRVLTSTP
jgi:WD40 repeat protein